MRTKLMVALCVVISHSASLTRAADPKIEIKKVDAKSQYDITYDGKLFTSYCYDDKDFFDKPVFWPVLSMQGNPVNRTWPMRADVPGEAHDHEHHQSLFFTYDEVNGVHFWNADKSMPRRRIKQREVSTEGNVLKFTLEWDDKEGKALLVENRKVTFGGGEDVHWMDHDILLAAQNADVTFSDTKEGAFGLRLAAKLQPAGGTGKYINADGVEGDPVWGKVSNWTAIRGMVGENGDEPVTVAIYSHPTSLNHPPYWHARNYGLFAANPFGRKSYDPKAEERKMILKAGDNLHLRFRVAVYAGKLEKDRLDKDYANFAK